MNICYAVGTFHIYYSSHTNTYPDTYYVSDTKIAIINTVQTVSANIIASLLVGLVLLLS
jgi:hypothetical protein